MLFQIFTAAEHNGLVAKNPASHIKVARNDFDEETEGGKDAFTEEEVAALIDHLADDLLGNSILLMIGSGMRAQELLGLRRADIEADGSVLHIRKAIEMVDGKPVLGPPKSKRSKRDIPIPENYRFYTERLLKLGGSVMIWESSRPDSLYSVGTFRRRFLAAIRKVSGVRPLTPHCCLNTYEARRAGRAAGPEDSPLCGALAHPDQS